MGEGKAQGEFSLPLMVFLFLFYELFLVLLAGRQCHPVNPSRVAEKQADCFGRAGSSGGQVDIGSGGLLEQLLFFSVPIELIVRRLDFPFSKKISLLHSHVLFLLWVEFDLVLVMGAAWFLFLLCM